MQKISSFSSASFITHPLSRTLALSICGKLLTPLSFYEGVYINGSVEVLSLSFEKILSLTAGKPLNENMKVVINGATTIAGLAIPFFSALLYPSIGATFIAGIGIKFFACRILFLFFQTIAISVFTKKKPYEGTLLHLNEWVRMSGFEENHVLAKQRICKFLASNRWGLGASELNLSDLSLSSLPDIFNNPDFNQLTQLNLSNNQLTTLPESFGQLRALKSLNLCQNKLTTLPESFGQLKALESLFLYDNQLTTLPESFGQLKALKKINFWKNKLTTLPESFGQLRALKSLDLWENQLTTLPESFGQLKALESLDLSNNQLTTLPECLGEFKALESLELSNNQLTTLPECLGEFKALESLKLSNNQLTTLPECLGEFKALESLELSNNQLTTLPECLGEFKALESLKLSNNQLTTLPESFGQLEALESLDLSNNQLTTLPECLGEFKALKKLYLASNELTTLPESLLQLSCNCEVDLTQCGLSENVIESLRQTIAAPSYAGPRIIYSISDRIFYTEEKSIEESLKNLYAIIGQPPKTFANLNKSPELKSWLNRLADTADYKSNTSLQKAFAGKIIEYLNQANDDPKFRDTFYQVIADASRTCGDRVTLSILHLSIAHQLATIDFKDMKNLANFLVKGPWTIKMLENAAREKCDTLRFFDEIEVYLGYPIHLKEALEIPIDVKNMLYFQCSALTKKDLEKAKKTVLEERKNPEKYMDFLVENDTWLDALKLNYGQEYQQIFDQRTNALESNASTNIDYQKINETFKQALKNLTRKVLF